MDAKDKEDSVVATVSAVPGQNRYKISLANMELEAYKIDLPDPNLFEVQVIKMEGLKRPLYFLCTYEITGERSLLVRALSPPKEPLANRDQIREFLKRAPGRKGRSVDYRNAL